MMDTEELSRVRAALASGRSVAVRGSLPRELPLPEGALVLRVRCGADRRPLGVWRELSARAAALLGEPDPERHGASVALQGAPRHRSLGPRHDPEGPAAIVRRLARLAARAPRGLVLVLDDVDRADEASAALLARLVSSPETFPVPMLLGVSSEEAAPAPDALLEAAAKSPTAVVSPTRRTEQPSASVTRAAVEKLDPEVSLTLRAAAVLGEVFDVRAVAAIRELSEARCLEHLQRAFDVGVPITDSGDGRLALPPDVVAQARAAVLPSLARAWHLRAAQHLAAPAPTPASARSPERREAEPAPVVAPAPAAAPDASDDDPVVRRTPPREGHRHTPRVTAPRVNQTHAPEELFDRAARERSSAPPSVAPRAPSIGRPLEGIVKPPPVSAGADSARAARHLAASGDLDGAARQLAAAMREAVAVGLSAQALGYGRDALVSLGELPSTPARRALRVEVLLALGTIRWQGAGPGADFSLRAAFDALREARAAVDDSDPAQLRGAVAAAFAGVASDLGDVAALDEALGDLSTLTRALIEEGNPRDAARLLNDQAAILLRVGDPVRAAWLLDRSREVFEREVDAMDADALRADPSALVELAETDHLYARLPLHAAARPGREADALALGRDHALAALEAYRRLGDRREGARVLETLARIELRAGHTRHAEERLREAVETQEALGDVLGLARSAGALAEVAARAGRFDEALKRLSDSVAFNVDKGSALGVAWNRLTLTRVGAAARTAGDPGVSQKLADVTAEIERAEDVVGPVRLPSDAL